MSEQERAEIKQAMRTHMAVQFLAAEVGSAGLAWASEDGMQRVCTQALRLADALLAELECGAAQ